MTESSNGLTRTLSNQIVQLLVPAILAAGASYVAVATQMARLEERLVSIRAEMVTQRYYDKQTVEAMRKADENLAETIKALEKRVP